jgi:hypothetical protein
LNEKGKRNVKEKGLLQGDYVMECQKKQNLKNCVCTYAGCDKKGMCCECISYHLSSKQLPGCCFPPEAEKTYDRSFKAFAKAWKL